MLKGVIEYLQSAWSPPARVASRTVHHHYHSSAYQPDTSLESLLEPIRFSMAFLTLFSLLSSVIIAIVLVPFGPLQLLAQLLSLLVSLSGLLGTFKRSLLLSSVYALSMILFLFLQCSYFFVLLKLVQEVNLASGASGGGGSNFGDKLSTTPFNSAELTSGDAGSGETGLAAFEHFPVLSTSRDPSPSLSRPQPGPSAPVTPSLYGFTYGFEPEVYSHYHRPVSVSLHVRHLSALLNEELAYLSLLTVPMLAWLPPSLFMESVAVLLLSMQALAGACFLYALRRSESVCRRADKYDSEQQAMLAADPT